MGKQQIGQVLKAKSGQTFYLKVEREVHLQPGDVVFLNKPADEIASLVTNGIIDETEGSTKLAKVPNFVVYNANLDKKAKGEILAGTTTFNTAAQG